MTQTALARELGLSKSLLTKYKKQGCPVSEGAEAVTRWRAEHIPERVKAEVNEVGALDIPEISFTPSKGEDFADALLRLKKRERDLDGEILSIQAYLRNKPTPKLHNHLPA